MLYQVKNEYFEQVLQMTKYVIGKNTTLIKQSIENAYPDQVEISILPEMSVYAKVKVLLGETPVTDKKGVTVFDDFYISGNAAHFLAFCFQEGELQYKSECQTCRKEFRKDKHCIERTPRHFFNNRTTLGQQAITTWYEYMERKYDILLPGLDYDEGEEHYNYPSFADFLYAFGIQVTGGITFTKCFADCLWWNK